MPDDRLPEIGIGTYDVAPPACTEAVKYALNRGYRHIDTAEMYDNQEAIGEAVDEADIPREDVFISTKIHSRNLEYEDVLDHARTCCTRLGVDTLDLLYVHWPIRSYAPEQTLAAFDELYERGVIQHVGISNFTPELFEEAIEVFDSPLFAHQVECHPFLPQDALRAAARENDHYLVAYSPLAKGTVIDSSTLFDIAAKHDASPAQVSLAWLLSKDNVVVIPKSTSQAHILENLRAKELSLDNEDIERIDAIDRTVRQVDFEGAPWN